jgi:putative endopeptidase
MLMRIRTLLIFITLMLVLACEADNEAIDASNFDTTVKPGDDFYLHANGAWMKANPIPDEYSRYGVFEILAKKNDDQMQAILKEAIEGNFADGSNWQKIGDFYASGMDTNAIEAVGFSPLEDEFKAINALRTHADVNAHIAHLSRIGVTSVIHFYAGQDEENSSNNIAQLMQAGITLPDRDYYLKEDARSQAIRSAFRQHLRNMFRLVGQDEQAASASAETVFAIEEGFARNSMTRLQRRDPHAVYNKMDLGKLADHGGDFSWQVWFTGIGNANPGPINVQQVDYIDYLGKAFTTIPVTDWQTYLQWKLLTTMAPYLHREVAAEDFAFFGTELSGRKVQRQRWKRVLATTNRALGEAVGEVYVARHFPPRAKERMNEMVRNLKDVMATRIDKLEWMSEATKIKAREKLGTMTLKIGYPEKWRNYDDLQIRNDAYVANFIRGREFATAYQVSKFNQPVDRSEWFMNPQTVNAYHNPNSNEIVFPAAILQPPFFFLDADDAVNYGAIGVVIGHEMTHAFDDQGRKYDKDGNLTDWWTLEDAERFEQRAGQLADFYDTFTTLDTLHVDGQLTLGENIADLGGVAIALEGLSLTSQFKNNEIIAELPPQQRFFYSYAQIWRQNIRPKELMRRLKEDVHSPGHFRVLGPLMHTDAFYTAFTVSDGDQMFVPEDARIRIW